MDRIKYNVSNLLININDTINGIGEDLTYTSVYDDIKKARFEEDNNLSQGIWEHDMQIPNWELVEKLSVEAIQNKSKDLQIIGWLIESIVILDKFEGIFNGIKILNEFIKKYWNTCYPLLNNNVSNTDQKSRILEWIYEIVYRRSNLIQLFGDNSFSLYNYEYSLEINSNIMKNPNNKNQIIESVKKNNIKLIEDINSIISNIDQEEIDQLNKNLINIKNNITEFKNTLEEKTNNDRAFTKLLNNIEKIEKLLLKRNKIAQNNRQNENKNILIDDKNINNNTTNNIELKNKKILNREEIYKLLNDLYLLLQEVDKHSPSPYLLKLILEWKDKTLLEIINDVKTGNTESHQLLKMLL